MNMGLFSGIKDSALSAAAKKFIADYLEKYGELQEFNIDSGTKQIRFQFLLKGENNPVSVLLKDYTVFRDDSKYFFKVLEADTNKEWLTLLFQDFLVKKSIEVPNQYYSYIKLLL
jgi:hypothetical protein